MRGENTAPSEMEVMGMEHTLMLLLSWIVINLLSYAVTNFI